LGIQQAIFGSFAAGIAVRVFCTVCFSKLLSTADLYAADLRIPLITVLREMFNVIIMTQRIVFFRKLK
jgi:hypothetical protein